MPSRVAAIRAVIGAAGAVSTAILLGVPTGIIDTQWYTRMTPVEWWNYPVWMTSSALAGALLATYVGPGRAGTRGDGSRRGFVGGLLSFLAVGCPVCNKVVVLAVGVSGALSWFAPAQPVLGVASVLLLASALRRRLRAMRNCDYRLAA